MADVVILARHPAVGAAMARLRSASTGPPAFRASARQLGALLALEATKELPTDEVTVSTPLGPAVVDVPAVPVVAVPVLRAGLGLLRGVEDVLPDIAVGMIGLERNEDTLTARQYYAKLPDLVGAWVLVLEPMLATGGSAATAAAAVREGAARVTVLSVVATQQALDRIADRAPGTVVVAAAVDPGLDDNGYIVPGLGDFGDRLWGTDG